MADPNDSQSRTFEAPCTGSQDGSDWHGQMPVSAMHPHVRAIAAKTILTIDPKTLKTTINTLKKALEACKTTREAFDVEQDAEWEAAHNKKLTRAETMHKEATVMGALIKHEKDRDAVQSVVKKEKSRCAASQLRHRALL